MYFLLFLNRKRTKKRSVGEKFCSYLWGGKGHCAIREPLGGFLNRHEPSHPTKSKKQEDSNMADMTQRKNAKREKKRE